jgi:hypothetical protein
MATLVQQQQLGCLILVMQRLLGSQLQEAQQCQPGLLLLHPVLLLRPQTPPWPLLQSHQAPLLLLLLLHPAALLQLMPQPQLFCWGVFPHPCGACARTGSGPWGR